MNIKFLDLKKNYLSIDKEINQEFINLFDKCDFIHGEKVKEFEKLGKKVFTLSLYDDQSVKNFKDELVKILKNKK